MFVPSLDLADASQASLYSSLSFFSSVILSNGSVDQIKSLVNQTGSTLYWASAKSVEEAVQLWDVGVYKVIFDFDTYAQAKDELSSIVAEDRIAVSANSLDGLEGLPVSTFLLQNTNDLETIRAFAQSTKKCLLSHGGERTVVVALDNVSLETIGSFGAQHLDVLVPASRLTTAVDDVSKINIAEAFLATAKTDRADGLYTTMVVDEFNKALGLVYSSKQSVAESIRLGQGVYQSRGRGLWHKGLTSGATQTLKHIDYDCDGDALRFVVEQHGAGFCHLNTRTCFGADSGITALEKTLKDRKNHAPAGSYTARLFGDAKLLRAKIMEEAEELCDATDKEEVAWEAADLIYFALTKCVSAGVSLADIEKNLNKKARKVTRRPGHAKPKWEQKDEGNAAAPVAPSAPVNTTAMNEGRIEMMKFNLEDISAEKRAELLLRPIIDSTEIINRVKPIMQQVRQGGDAAIQNFTRQFDRVELDQVTVKAPFDPALMELDPITKTAIDQAYDNIYKFHDAQLDKEMLVVETMPGVVCSRFSRPIERVGLYVPGGSAVLPSTTLMLGIPAKVAGCKEIVIATPPRPDGSVVPEVLYVAHKVGASHVVKAGGAQAVAAMAYGTETVPKVDKIFGPGNQYVTAAKMVAQNDTSCLVSIDMPAGPSEVLVIADKSSNPVYVAADLLSQAEHGPDSQVVLLAVDLSPEHLHSIEEEVHKQALALPRCDIVRKSIPHSYSLSMKNLEEAMQFSNEYAPEHLILHLENASSVLPLVDNAGSVFVGQYSPESFGDYASGTNHTLPTYGYSRMYSGVNTNGFVKHITSQEVTAEGMDKLADTVMRLAEIEGLEAHRNAVAVRVADLRK
ncbi:histidinol dehydrogenase-domain-containing protein [Gilbertella persicaria]|uniref:Histidine biosynthesis trifunctional protein n=1 Tax=Rhizopus stolonifer TaxID=4846 RepID=A0A367KPK0_RHIST|nr:histidinol dehydrogenase-domain-containing protein [Gilbertella persicaria]KAI8098027.1 histidinol dehydrogenase-domain-containing protein [Gilbertella persicaria]RCI03782.1 trifunctional histidinol dehydrogenase [Rhizopus stolonifer]